MQLRIPSKIFFWPPKTLFIGATENGAFGVVNEYFILVRKPILIRHAVLVPLV